MFVLLVQLTFSVITPIPSPVPIPSYDPVYPPYPFVCPDCICNGSIVCPTLPPIPPCPDCPKCPNVTCPTPLHCPTLPPIPPCPSCPPCPNVIANKQWNRHLDISPPEPGVLIERNFESNLIDEYYGSWYKQVINHTSRPNPISEIHAITGMSIGIQSPSTCTFSVEVYHYASVDPYEIIGGLHIINPSIATMTGGFPYLSLSMAESNKPFFVKEYDEASFISVFVSDRSCVIVLDQLIFSCNHTRAESVKIKYNK